MAKVAEISVVPVPGASLVEGRSVLCVAYKQTGAYQYFSVPTARQSQAEDMIATGAEFLALLSNIGSPVEAAIARAKIEEAVMWAVKSIAG